jgi:hypothetical protein
MLSRFYHHTACRWPLNYPQFLKGTDDVLLDVVQDAQQVVWRDPELARELHDAVAVKLCSGAPMPQRPSSLTYLQAPMMTTPMCEHPDCRQKGCKGSRVVVDSQGGGVQFIFNHHKTHYGTGQHVVTFPADTALSKAMVEYKKWGWRMLVGHKRGLMTRFFMTPEGEAFKDEKAFTSYVNDRMKKQTGLQLGCRDYRTVAGTELNGLVEDAGVREGLAMGMGTSINMWKKTYAPNYKEVQIQRSVVKAIELIQQQQQQHERILEGLGLGKWGGRGGEEAPSRMTRPKRRYYVQEGEENDGDEPESA